MQQEIYYRPEWTCGRYIHEKRAAICYNLIEGMSYFFDEDSAEIIGAILAVPRNGAISVQGIANLTNTAMSSLRPFLNELCRMNLLTVDIPSQKGIANYREGVSQWRRNQSVSTEKTTEEKLPMAVTNAEMTYGERVGGVFSVMFELTYNCSEKCIHCYNIGATRNDEEQSHRADTTLLTIDDYKRIIDQLYDEGLVKACLSGGDPFSNPLAWEIIQYLYDKEVVIDIYTNGQRIVKDVERLASYYPRTVGVSIYSSEARVHDFITRIPGSWDRSMAVLNRLTELAVPLYVKCCVMRPNFKSYRGVGEIARNLGAQPQFEINLTDSIEGDKCVSRYLRLTPEQYEIAFRDDNIPMYVGPEAPQYGSAKRGMSQNACGSADFSFCVTPDGQLIPCCSFHKEFGSLRELSVKEALQSPDLAKWRKTTLADYEECGRYDYCDYCNLCPGLAQSEHGSYLKASENCCYVAKIRHNLAMRMMNDGYDPLHGKTLEDCINDFPDYIPQQIKRTF